MSAFRADASQPRTDSPRRAPNLRPLTGFAAALVPLTVLTLAVPPSSAHAAPVPAVAAPPVAAPSVAAPSVVRTAVDVVRRAATAPVIPTAVIASRLAQRALSAQLRGRLAGIVIDGRTGAGVWNVKGTAGVMPASLTKVATAVAAYRWLGPDKRLTTSVLRSPGAASVYLRGGGDPMLTSSALARMAVTTATHLRAARKTQVVVVVDDRLFPTPTNAPGWRSSYVPSEVSPIRALGVHGRHSRDTAVDAGKVFAAALARYGVKAVAVRRGTTPANAAVLASSISPTVKGMVARMLLASDNQIAETLLRMSARGAGLPATWSNAIKVRDRALAGIGAPAMKLVDGSGLSRSNRITPLRFALLLRAIATNPAYAEIVTALPLSGVSGTLAKRYRTAPASCARADVNAKTGTLDDVIGLGGYARTPDGQVRIFTFVRTGKRSSAKAVTTELDRLVATAVGCW